MIISRFKDSEEKVIELIDFIFNLAQTEKD